MQKNTQAMAMSKHICEGVREFAKKRGMTIGNALDLLVASALKLRGVQVKEGK